MGRFRAGSRAPAVVALFLVIIALSMGVRLQEGRVVSEPAFTLLLAAEAGALAGFVAGYYRTRALADKRRAEPSAEGLAVVNSVIRHDLRNDLQIISHRRRGGLRPPGRSVRR